MLPPFFDVVVSGILLCAGFNRKSTNVTFESSEEESENYFISIHARRIFEGTREMLTYALMHVWLN